MNDSKIIEDLEAGYGKCPDCIWYNQPEGCNVARGSNQCLLNRKPK